MTEHEALTDQVAVITGAGRGIGAATARLFAARGAHVIVAARTASMVQAVASDITAGGGSARAIACDVSRPEDVERLVAESLSWHARIDILINNAGTCIPVPLVDMEPQIFERHLAGNLTASYLCCRAVLPAMIERRSGAIINVASISGVRGSSKFPGFSAYAAAKAGVIVLTEALAVEVKDHGIRVNAVSPGSVDTPLLSEVAPGAIPAMSAEQVADILLFVASGRARPINGSNIEVFG